MAVQTISVKKATFAYIGWWLFWATIHVLVLHRLGIGWRLAQLDSIVSNGLLAIICSVALTIFKYYQPGSGNRMYRLLTGVVITIAYTAILHWLFHLFFSGNIAYQSFLMLSMPVRFMFSLLMISFVTLLNWLRNNMADEKEHARRRLEAEQLVKEAELVKLRQQLQPHFLFNSLNSISALAGSKPDEARKMIHQLSDFLRGTLKKDEQQTVPFHDELEHLKLYLDIEKVRFGHRLNIDMNIESSSSQLQLPPLLLQPIVENAIKFGLYGTIDEITVSIASRIENTYLVIEVKNPFDEQTQNVKQGTGFGLSSVQRRLFLLYSRADLLSTEKHNNTFITRLKIPQLK